MLLKMNTFQRVLGGFEVIFGKVLAACGDFVVAFRCGIEFEFVSLKKPVWNPLRGRCKTGANPWRTRVCFEIASRNEQKNM